MTTATQKRILVTGGAGFLGSHLCERLLDAGHKVLCLDNFQSGDAANIAHLHANPRFELLRQDVTTPLTPPVDEIYNLACPASPPDYQADPIKTLLTSVQGAVNVLELARLCGARVFQASTSEVYGDPTVHPQPEDYWGHVNPIGVRACYDEGKRSAETLFFDYNRQHGVDIKVVRIFNTYGPRMRPDDGRVVSNFIVQALRGEDLTIYGDGTQTRSFCYCSDMIDGFLSMMGSAPGVQGPVNLGNPAEFTILELAEKVLHRIGGPSKLRREPLPLDDPKQRRPDISRAKALLGWAPKIPLEEGLDRTISHFRRKLDA